MIADMSMAELTIADERTLARDAAGARARKEGLMLDRLVETMRLASFRSYLVATVHSMSAIVPDVLAMAGSDVGSALQRIRPGHRWPGSTMVRKVRRRPQSPPLFRRVAPSPSFANPGTSTYPLTPLVGDAIISEGAPGEWIEASILGDCLEIVLRSDGYELSTHGGTAQLKLAGSLPATVTAACVGRPLAAVVDHPLLRAGGFVIERVAQVAGSTRLSFRVGRVDIEMPWRP